MKCIDNQRMWNMWIYNTFLIIGFQKYFLNYCFQNYCVTIFFRCVQSEPFTTANSYLASKETSFGLQSISVSHLMRVPTGWKLFLSFFRSILFVLQIARSASYKHFVHLGPLWMTGTTTYILSQGDGRLCKWKWNKG